MLAMLVAAPVCFPAAGGPSAADEASARLQLGARIFARTCSVCHGEKGDGAVWTNQSLRRPPRNFRSEASRAELTTARIRTAVMAGVPGTAMMSFATQLSPTEMSAVVAYIEAEFLGRGATTTRLDATAGTFPARLRGDREWGRRFYAGNCATCHGLAGDGQGPRAYFIAPPPRNFRAADARHFDRAALFAAVSDGTIGTEMPAWRQVLSPQEIADVAEYVYTEFIAAPAAGRR